VDAGPDAFVATYKYRRTFASAGEIQPQWVAACVAEQNFNPRLCRPEGVRGGIWLQATTFENGSVEIFIMFARTAFSYERGSDEHINNTRNDGWNGEYYGLSQVLHMTLIDMAYLNQCGTDSLSACTGPGRQVIVTFDIDQIDITSQCNIVNDFDCLPEIRVTYLHTAPFQSVWDTECSNQGTYIAQLVRYYASRANPVCIVDPSDIQISLVGTAQNIGFSSAPHLHYTVYIDRNGNGIFPFEDTDVRELIDPLSSLALPR
jgi:hypothetical protein